jgi:hypothetical protein
MFGELCRKKVRAEATTRRFVLSEDAGDRYTRKAGFISNGCGLEFRLECREHRVLLSVARVQDGKMPVFPTPLRFDSIIDIYDLDFILMVRAPESVSAVPVLLSVEEQIKQRLALTIQFAGDILNGDFRFFSEAREILLTNARKYGATLGE